MRPDAVAALSIAILAVPAHAAGTGASPRPSLIASPAHIALLGAAGANVRVRSTGVRTRVEAVLVPYALDLRGRPRLTAAARPPGWLTVRPTSVLVDAAGAQISVTARPPRGASAGDHVALLLLTTSPHASGSLRVLMRIGIVVSDRVPGRLERRLVLRTLRIVRRGRQRLVELSLENDGNVTESLARGRIVVAIAAGRRVVARLQAARRDLLPHSRGVVLLACPRRVHGRVVAHVRVGAVLRTYPLRL